MWEHSTNSVTLSTRGWGAEAELATSTLDLSGWMGVIVDECRWFGERWVCARDGWVGDGGMDVCWRWMAMDGLAMVEGGDVLDG